MKPDVMLLAICHPDKLKMLEEVIPSYNNISHMFGEKFLMVDEFSGMSFPDELLDRFTNMGWTVKKVQNHSRTKTMLECLEYIKSDWVFYSEDDIVIDLYPEFDFDKIKFEMHDDGYYGPRALGMLSLSFGGTIHDLAKGDLGDLEHYKKNTVYRDGKSVCFARIDQMRDSWFFEFPTIFIRKEILQTCLEHAHAFYSGLQIEMSLTKAWFGTEIESRFEKNIPLMYYKASILRSEIDDIPGDPMRLIDDSRFFKIIDPTQGRSNYGGNHNA
jgi:hypothetical protein